MEISKIKTTAKGLQVIYNKLNDTFSLTSKDAPSPEFKAAWLVFEEAIAKRIPNMESMTMVQFKDGTYIVQGNVLNEHVEHYTFQIQIQIHASALDPLWLELEKRARQYVMGARAQATLFNTKDND